MGRRVLLCGVILVGVLAGCVGARAGGRQVATDLAARAECEAAGSAVAVARLSWTPAPAGGAQRVVVTIFRNGFDRPDVDRSPDLAADQRRLDWTRLHGQATHYWRVLTKSDGTWVPSETASFEGPLCIVDRANPPSQTRPAPPGR